MHCRTRKTSSFFILLIATLLTTQVAAQNEDVSAENRHKLIMTKEENTTTLADSLINYAYKYLNTPYRRGTSGTKSFDCSGFSSFIFKYFGYNLSRTSQDQAKEGVEVKREDVRKGDLVFFQGRNAKQKRVGHVGIVYEIFPDGTFSFIHASVKYGVTITEVEKDYYRTRFVTIRRVLEEKILLTIEPLDVKVSPLRI